MNETSVPAPEKASLPIQCASAAACLSISEEALRGILQNMGVTQPDLKDDQIFKFCDFREAVANAPIAAVRKAYRELRAGKPESAGDPRLSELQALGYKVKLEDADVVTLLKNYRADLPNDPVTVALKKKFGDKPVVAFRVDGAVAVEESASYIADLEQNYPESKFIGVDGQLETLHPIGFNAGANAMVEEDPLFPGSPLRHGRSLVNHRNWNDISIAQRQFCRVIMQQGHIDVNNQEAVLALMAKAAKGDLCETYPDAKVVYRQLEREDALPKLKIKLGGTQTKNNPFGVNRKY